jgi:hypothetical protein
MKTTLLSAIALTCAGSLSAGVVFVDLANLAIPADSNGIFINILDGTTSFDFPGGFESAPWLNLYDGGAGIANSPGLRLWASATPYVFGSDHFLNVDPGVTVDGSGLFVSEETVSESHLYTDSGEIPEGLFGSDEPGYLAFQYDLPGAAGIGYGWFRVLLTDSGTGVAFDLARTDTHGESIIVGAVPEPAAFAALAGSVGLFTALAARRRRVR